MPAGRGRRFAQPRRVVPRGPAARLTWAIGRGAAHGYCAARSASSRRGRWSSARSVCTRWAMSSRMPADAVEVGVGGVVDLPVLVARAGVDGQASPQPIVMTASAALTTSSVIGLGNSLLMSMPSSDMAVDDVGVDLLGGRAAGRADVDTSARRSGRAGRRPSGCGLRCARRRTALRGRAWRSCRATWPRARRRSRAKRSTISGS